jgi:hypothetical protein
MSLADIKSLRVFKVWNERQQVNPRQYKRLTEVISWVECVALVYTYVRAAPQRAKKASEKCPALRKTTNGAKESDISHEACSDGNERIVIAGLRWASGLSMLDARLPSALKDKLPGTLGVRGGRRAE